MNRELAAQFVSTTRRLDGINVSNQVCNRYIRRCQFLHVALISREVSDGSGVSQFCDFFTATATDRSVRVVVDFTTCDVGDVWVKQCG